MRYHKAMRMDEALFSEIVQALGAAPEPGKELGRRRCMRHRAEQEITIKPHGVVRPSPRTVKVVDLSPDGLGIIDERAASAGDRFVAYLPLADGKTQAMICQAQHSRLTSGGAFRIGAEFTEGEHLRRFVCGADGVVDEDLLEPAKQPTQRGTVHTSGGTSEVAIRGLRDGVFELLGERQMASGDEFVLEARLPQRVAHWHCTVISVKTAPDDQYVIFASNRGEVEYEKAKQKRRGLLGWLGLG